MQKIICLFSLLFIVHMQASAPVIKSVLPTAVQLYNERAALVQEWKSNFNAENKVYAVYGEERLHGEMYRKLDGTIVFREGQQWKMCESGEYVLLPEQDLTFDNPKDAWRFYAYESDFARRQPMQGRVSDKANSLLVEMEKKVEAQDKCVSTQSSQDLSILTWLDERIKSNDEGYVFIGFIAALKYTRDVQGQPCAKWLCVDPSTASVSIDKALLEKAKCVNRPPGGPSI